MEWVGNAVRALVAVALANGMVPVPAGSFNMGGGDEDDEQPGHRVYLPAFQIDRDEVTRADYQRCVSAGTCAAPSGSAEPDVAVTGVSWRDAGAYCRFAGKRLPTGGGVGKAARGTDGRIYPWGNQPSCDQANFGNFEGEGRCPHNPGRPVRVGSYPGASPYGARDLAGNVWEWVADRYDARYYRRSPARDPKGPAKGALRVVRGGACCSMFGLPRASNRLAFPRVIAILTSASLRALDALPTFGVGPKRLLVDAKEALTVEHAAVAEEAGDQHAQRLARGASVHHRAYARAPAPPGASGPTSTARSPGSRKDRGRRSGGARLNIPRPPPRSRPPRRDGCRARSSPGRLVDGERMAGDEARPAPKLVEAEPDLEALARRHL